MMKDLTGKPALFVRGYEARWLMRTDVCTVERETVEQLAQWESLSEMERQCDECCGEGQCSSCDRDCVDCDGTGLANGGPPPEHKPESCQWCLGYADAERDLFELHRKTA